MLTAPGYYNTLDDTPVVPLLAPPQHQQQVVAYT
jgi:hypothetical protein